MSTLMETTLRKEVYDSGVGSVEVKDILRSDQELADTWSREQKSTPRDAPDAGNSHTVLPRSIHEITRDKN